MGLETTSTIGGLDETYPLPGDPRSQGQAHLTLIKHVLKNMMPGAGGDGWETVVVATEAELNHLAGVTSPIQDQFDAITGTAGELKAPAGTKLLFHNAVAPNGWTIDATHDSRIIVTNANGAGSGWGKDSVYKFAHAHATQSHVLTENEMPPHQHPLPANTDPGSTISYRTDAAFQQRFKADGNEHYGGETTYAGGGAAHNHGNTLSVEWEPMLTFVILAVKN